MLRKLLAVLLVLIVALPGAVPVFAQSAASESAGAVYVMTNAESGNQVIAYRRAADGMLSHIGTFDTGGSGSGVGITVPPDPLGSQNALLLSPDGKWLFAVNAGSDQVTAFETSADGLERTDIASSGGDYPVSLSYRSGILYVLNAGGEGSVSGFRVSRDGNLTHLRGSTRSLHANTPADGSQPNISESPSQVGFSPDGNFLIVTDKGGITNVGRILVFHLNDSSIPDSRPAITTTKDPVPFAFVFDSSDHLIVASAGINSVASYALKSDGSLHQISFAETTQKATCWIAYNGSFLYTDNPGSNSVSTLKASSSGKLTLLDGAAAATGDGTAPLDMGISRDGKYLYSLETAAGVVGEYRINDDSSLTFLDTIGGFDKVAGTQGIAVR